MIKIQGNIPRNVLLACSGGVDSMAALDFLSRNHNVIVFNFNHGTEYGKKVVKVVEDFCFTKKIEVITQDIKTLEFPKGSSKEAWWRDERYKWFHKLSVNRKIITCHHLDDCVENWIWSSMHGNPHVVPYRNGNVIRPFRLNRKREFELWCQLNNVPYLEDDSNTDLCYTRNYIRHKMMPHVLRVNPGIHKLIKKKISSEVVNDD